jgi:hypothetical protein
MFLIIEKSEANVHEANEAAGPRFRGRNKPTFRSDLFIRAEDLLLTRKGTSGLLELTKISDDVNRFRLRPESRVKSFHSIDEV